MGALAQKASYDGWAVVVLVFNPSTRGQKQGALCELEPILGHNQFCHSLVYTLRDPVSNKSTTSQKHARKESSDPRPPYGAQ